MSLIFIISKNIHQITKFAISAALGGPYFNKTLLTVKLSTCAASLTFIMECSVSLICSMHNFRSI